MFSCLSALSLLISYGSGHGAASGFGTRANTVLEAHDKTLLSSHLLWYFQCSFRQEAFKHLRLHPKKVGSLKRLGFLVVPGEILNHKKEIFLCLHAFVTYL